MSDDTAIQPMHDAPRCKCGEGVLVPVLHDQGMTRPRMPEPWPADSRGSHCMQSMLRCTASGDEFQANQTQVLQAWWAVGAKEQSRHEAAERERVNWLTVTT